MSADLRHPVFARVFHLLSRREDTAGQREFRRENVAGLAGRVVELGGCHASRDTLAAIEQAGFVVERSRRLDFRPTPLVASATPRVLGVARRPGST